MRRAIVLIVACTVLIGFVGLSLLYSRAPLVRDVPRTLPWTLPDYRQAKTQWRVTREGKIEARVEHFFLQGISPAMISWFYQQLPVATVSVGDNTYPLYHIFHPTEHGTLRVLEVAANEVPGMGEGALIERLEWFGPYDSTGVARIAEFSNAGMFAIPEVAGIPLGEVRHTFAAENGGTRYRVDSVIGSDTPFVGRLLNWYLRTYVFHEDMIHEWQRHQVEEVASLRFFLAEIYQQRENGNHYTVH